MNENKKIMKVKKMCEDNINQWYEIKKKPSINDVTLLLIKIIVLFFNII